MKTHRYYFIVIYLIFSGCSIKPKGQLTFDYQRDIENIKSKTNTFIYYSPAFMMSDKYSFPPNSVFFIYLENNEYKIKLFSRFDRKPYLTKEDVIKKRNKRQLNFIEGPYIINADTIFRYFEQQKISSIKQSPKCNPSLDDAVSELLYLKQGNDTTFFTIDHCDYEKDSLHTKSKLLKLTVDVIKDRDLKYRKVRTKIYGRKSTLDM